MQNFNLLEKAKEGYNLLCQAREKPEDLFLLQLKP